MIHDLDAARAAWQSADSTPPEALIRSLEAARVRLAALHRAVRHRDRLETVVALVLAPVFAVVAWRTPHAVSALGAAILTAACLFIPFHLRRARRYTDDRGGPVIAAVKAELHRVQAQERLLGTVFWWYLLPLGIGVILLVGGAPVSTTFKIGYAIVVTTFGAVLYFLNRRAARVELEPVSRELKRWLAEATEEIPEGSDVR